MKLSILENISLDNISIYNALTEKANKCLKSACSLTNCATYYNLFLSLICS